MKSIFFILTVLAFENTFAQSSHYFARSMEAQECAQRFGVTECNEHLRRVHANMAYWENQARQQEATVMQAVEVVGQRDAFPTHQGLEALPPVFSSSGSSAFGSLSGSVGMQSGSQALDANLSNEATVEEFKGKISDLITALEEDLALTTDPNLISQISEAIHELRTLMVSSLFSVGNLEQFRRSMLFLYSNLPEGSRVRSLVLNLGAFAANRAELAIGFYAARGIPVAVIGGLPAIAEAVAFEAGYSIGTAIYNEYLADSIAFADFVDFIMTGSSNFTTTSGSPIIFCEAYSTNSNCP